MLNLLVLSLFALGVNGAPWDFGSDQQHTRLLTEVSTCIAKSLAKYQEGAIKACDLIEEVLDSCVGIFAPYGTENEVHDLRVKEADMLISSLSLQGTKIDYNSCSVFARYNIDKSSGADQATYGLCSAKKFQEASASSMKCFSNSAANFPQQSKGDICDHVQSVMNTCFSSVEQCFTSQEQVTAYRRLVIDTVIKTLEESDRIRGETSGINFRKCNLS